jgi:FKBP-type peptidyl-prolyl cis-trans isomerase
LSLIKICDDNSTGCLGMALGEERLLVIPAEEGYGKGGMFIFYI